MLLHIGENRFVPSASIVAIVPADNVPAETDRLIRSCAEAGRYYPSYGTPKSSVSAMTRPMFMPLQQRSARSKNGLKNSGNMMFLILKV